MEAPPEATKYNQVAIRLASAALPTQPWLLLKTRRGTVRGMLESRLARCACPEAYPTFQEQEDHRLFQAAGGLAAIRHCLEMMVRMLAARPVNVETGELDRDAKPLYQQLMEGQNDDGLFSGARSPFKSQEFDEFVVIM
jgi:hypothetical protein